MAFVPGLVSVTFRPLTPREIVGRASSAGLRAIEWGGDVHVPAGDERAASEAAALTSGAGLRIASYGSYLRLGDPPSEERDRAVLASAQALGAPSVRVWAGRCASDACDAQHRSAIAAHGAEFADTAAAVGLAVVLEYHADTLTDDAHSALRLLEAIDRENVFLGWQPPNHMGFADRLACLDLVADHVHDVHVFNWTTAGDGPIVRHPLREACAQWRAYFDRLAEDGRSRPALLEFVPGDDPDVLDREAEALLGLL